MKRISIQDLKAGLSAAVAEAESGGTILITRHNEPVARLGPARPAHLHPSRRGHDERLRPALSRATKGRYLEILQDDARSPDLAHLRTALWFHGSSPIDRFVTMDGSQQAAAKELGLPV